MQEIADLWQLFLLGTFDNQRILWIKRVHSADLGSEIQHSRSCCTGRQMEGMLVGEGDVLCVSTHDMIAERIEYPIDVFASLVDRLECYPVCWIQIGSDPR